MGVNVSKDIYVESLTDDPIQWKIVEIKINADFSPYSEILDECENLSRSSGSFSFAHQLTKTSYKIIDKVKKNSVRFNQIIYFRYIL